MQLVAKFQNFAGKDASLIARSYPAAGDTKNLQLIYVSGIFHEAFIWTNCVGRNNSACNAIFSDSCQTDHPMRAMLAGMARGFCKGAGRTGME